MGLARYYIEMRQIGLFITTDMEHEIQEKLFVSLKIAFALVAVNSRYNDKNTCHQQSMC